MLSQFSDPKRYSRCSSSRNKKNAENVTLLSPCETPTPAFYVEIPKKKKKILISVTFVKDDQLSYKRILCFEWQHSVDTKLCVWKRPLTFVLL